MSPDVSHNTTGDIVQETPGSVHTLVLEEDSEVLFIIEGALEFLDVEGHTLAHEDWKSIMEKYRDFCVGHGVSMVDVTRPLNAKQGPCRCWLNLSLPGSFSLIRILRRQPSARFLLSAAKFDPARECLRNPFCIDLTLGHQNAP